MPRPRSGSAGPARTGRAGGRPPVPRTSSMGRAAAATSSPNRRVTGSGSGAADSHSPASASAPARNSSAGRGPQRRRARPSRCRCRRPARPGPAGRPQVQRERADGDDHRVPGADLGELLGPAARAGSSTAVISSSGGQRVALGAGEELGRRDQPRAADRRGLDDGPGGQQHRVAVPGRRGGAQVAADRAAVADLRRPDGACRHGQARQQAAQLGDDPGVGHPGPEPHLAVAALPDGELG